MCIPLKPVISRVWEKIPKLIDEATSALDEKTEAQVLKNLLTALPDTACILTTHRPGALKYCTRLYKAENGALTCIEVNKPA